MTALLHDPLFYTNYAIAIVTCFILWRFGRTWEVESFPRFFIKFFVLTIVVCFALYWTQKLGDMSLIKLGMKP